MNPWYVIQTQPRREDVAETWLARYCEEVFCPRHRARVNVHGYRRDVERPLFPGYLFACFELTSRLRAVRHAYGVRDLVCFGAEPAEVPEDLLESIRARMRDGLVVLDPPRFRQGERVEVVEGVLRGYTGIFERELNAAKRVAILLDTLRWQARVILKPEALRAAT